MLLTKKLRIAYLILAHSSPKVLERLIIALNENPENVYFFIHIDAQANIKLFDNVKNKWDNVKFITKRVDIQWGSYSMVKAITRLMRFSLMNNNFDRLVLLSGVDYPIVSNQKIAIHFNKYPKTQFINLVKMPHAHKPIWRVTKFHIPGGTSRGAGWFNKQKKKINDKLLHINSDRDYLKILPKKVLYGGSQWFSLTRKCVRDILMFTHNNRKFVRFFKYTAIPDEMFFHTILMNLDNEYNILPGLTYSDWSRPYPPYPANITAQHVDEIKRGVFSDNGYSQTEYFFVRKISEDDITILDEIDNNLRKI